MNLQEIKEAVNKGLIVCWSSNIYNVIKDSKNQYLIKCTINSSCIGLTWADGTTLNGDEKEFYIPVYDNLKAGDKIEFFTCCNADRKPLTGIIEDNENLGLICIVNGELYEVRKLVDIKVIN